MFDWESNQKADEKKILDAFEAQKAALMQRKIEE